MYYRVTMVYRCVIYVVLFVLINTKHIRSRCTFPEYMWRPPGLINIRERTWITETRFYDKTDLWDSLIEITATQSTITAKIRNRANCNDYAGTVPCFKKHFHWRKTCMDDQRRLRPDTFAVFHEGNGHSFYTCFRTINRGDNIVQIYTGIESTENHDELCNPGLMVRNNWPWIDPTENKFHPCPITGGFDFRTYLFNKKRKVCNRVWRSSRLESECVAGDGLSFLFPERSCSPFEEHELHMNVHCVGSWEESNYIFLVTRQGNHTPHFVVRFPQDYSTRSEFVTHVYFSPVASLEPTGIPAIANVHYAKLQMTSSEPGTCYDESRQCSNFASKGLCSNLGEYGNYCKRTCGLCDLLPSRRSECRFPLPYLGEYHLFSREQHTSIHIHSGLLDISDLGEFVCKAKHWELNQYKLMSYYSNGCRPRYTCINFGASNEVSLQYRLSNSVRGDGSFEICEFRDDPPPMGSAIRSGNMKTLISGSAISDTHTCGLHGTIRLNASIVSGGNCEATLSDWRADTCDQDDRLTLDLHNCHGNGITSHQYICMTYLTIHDDVSFLVTQHSVYTERYNCWMIYTYPEFMSYRPWRNIYVLPQETCANWINSDAIKPDRADIILRAYSDDVEKPCHQVEPQTTRHSDGSQHNRKDTSAQMKEKNKQPLFLSSYGNDEATSVGKTQTLNTMICAIVVIILVL